MKRRKQHFREIETCKAVQIKVTKLHLGSYEYVAYLQGNSWSVADKRQMIGYLM